MDRVRFGRVMGKGARLAVRTALEAVDAATAAAPNVEKARQPSTHLGAVASSAAPASKQRAALRMPSVSLPSGLLPAARAAGTGVLTPLKQASRALWHELTGSFFALFALSFALGVWHTRTALHSKVPGDRNRLAAFCMLALVFLYFSVSSFARARRRNAA